jgi:hypothetical protein
MPFAEKVHTLRLEIRGTQLRLFVDGKHVGDAVYRENRPGGLGLWVIAQQGTMEARFRRVRVWALPPER